MSQFPNSMPGIGSALAAVPRTVITIPTTQSNDFLPSGRIVDGAAARDPGNSAVNVAELRPGILLGKITGSVSMTSGLVPTVGCYGASILGTVTNAILGGTTTASTLGTSMASEIVRRVGSSGTLTIIAPPSTGGTVAAQNFVYSAVNVTTGVITHTAPAAAAIAGAILGALDGTASPVTIYCGDVWSMRVTDVNGANQLTPLRLIPITNKPIDITMIPHYPTDISLIAWLKAKLRAAVPGMSFSDDF